MNKVLFFGLVILAPAIGCGERTIKGAGESTTQARTVSGTISAIDIVAPVTAEIHVVPGAQPSIQFTGYKNLVEEIRTKTEGNTLVIESRRSIRFSTGEDVTATITVPTLEELSIHGAADAKVDGEIRSNDFRLVISGAGDVSIAQLHVNTLEAKISGTGNVELLSGDAASAEYKVSGAGNIRSFGVQTAKVKAKVSGTGNIDVFATHSLEAKVSGAGTIQYKGSATVKSETSGIGSVVAAQ